MIEDIAVFVLARAAEREEMARNANGPRWERGFEQVVTDASVGVRSLVVSVDDDGASTGEIARPGDRFDEDHIAHHDPARTLREVAAVRAIVAAFEQRERESEQAAVFGYHATGLLLALRHLASVDSDHTEFQPEWAT
jgi:hypothetical protein